MTTATAPVRRATDESQVSVGIAMVFLLLMAGYFLLPIYWLVVNATKSQRDLVTTNGFWFGEFQLGQNLADLFARDGGVFLRWALNSLLYAGLGAGIGTVLAAMAGYGIAKFDFRGRELLFGFALGGVLVPATALALPLFLMFAGVGLTNTFWSVFLPSIVSPFGVYLSRVYSATIPEEVLEAARVDGAGELRIFFSISVRILTPALVTVFLFQFVAVWNNFLLPLVMLQDSTLYPLTYGLFSWQSQVSRYPELQTLTIVGSLVSVIPLIITFLGLQRFWRAGLTAGSEK